MYDIELEKEIFDILQLNVAYTPKDVAMLVNITIPKANIICHHLVAKDKLIFLKRLDNEFQPYYCKVVTKW